MSPRSGTPVKLLGREDASVDWYNLEKSKRVKAFRCGEFDDCIRRAESSQGIPPKKREKYARREDAIIHALELEKQHYGKKRQKLGIGSNCLSNKMIDASNKQLGSYYPSENFMGNEKARDQCKYMNLKSHTLSKKPDSFLEEESMCNLLHVQKGKHSKPSWEDDNSEATPRMRGLQDFGLRIATSKRKLSSSIGLRGSRKPFSADELYDFSSVRHDIDTLYNVSGDKSYMPVKSKRSQGGVAEEKRRDRRRPLVQVLQSSAKLPVCQSLQSDGDTMSITLEGEKEKVGPLFQAKRSSKCVYLPVESNDHLDHEGFPSEQMQMQMSPSHFGMDNSLIHPGSLTEECTSSGLMEAQESDSSEGGFLDPDIKEEETLLSDPANLGMTRFISCGGSVYQVPMRAGNMSNEELDESELSSYICQLHPPEQTAGIASDMGVSKWQLKGKRNIRNLTKRHMELIDGKDSVVIADKCNLSIHKSLCKDKGDIRKVAKMNSQRALGRQVLCHRGEELSYTYEEGDQIENYLEQTRGGGFSNRRYQSMLLKTSSGDRGRSNNSIISSDEDSHVISPLIWEADRLSQETLRGYWEESDGCFDPIYAGRLGDRVELMLLDVDIKVQATYQGERVPLVSLMSKLNGKAIVGHPVQVETLEDGSYGLPRDDTCEDRPDTDGNTALPQVWRTARRTAMHRVPCPPSSAAVDGEEAMFSDFERKRPFKYMGDVKHKVMLMKRRSSHIRRPQAHKFPKKLLKKASLASQKTRTLSSITIEQKPSRKNGISKLADRNDDLHGSIKPEKAPVVTCVPVKLVFSRIREAIGRPPSAAANHGALITASAERKPS